MTSCSTSSETAGRGKDTGPPSELAADAVNRDEAQAAKLGQKIDLAVALLQPNPESPTATREQLSVPVVSKFSAELRHGQRTLSETFQSSSPRALESGVPLAGAAGLSEGIYRLRTGWACQFRVLVD